jgi:hypothetical protein
MFVVTPKCHLLCVIGEHRNVKNHVSMFSHNTKKVTFWCHNEHGVLLVVDASVGL